MLISTPLLPSPTMARQLTFWEGAGVLFGGRVRSSKENYISLQIKGKLEVAWGENTIGKAKPVIAKMVFKALQPMLPHGIRYHTNRVRTTEPSFLEAGHPRSKEM